MSGSIVTIEDCTASQIVGSETFKIAHGTLSLEHFSSEPTGAPLLLKIDDKSFALPIERDAIVGTRGDRSYLFSKRLAPAATLTPESISTKVEGDLKEVPLESPSAGGKKEDVLLVQIDMPVTASEASLTKFEKSLVDYEFLLVGAQADADNLSRAFMEWTGLKTKDLKSYTAQQTSGDSTKNPAQFSDTTHSLSSGAATGTTTFSEAAANVGQTINAGMASIGSFLGSKIGTKGLFAGATDAEPGVKRDVSEAVSDGVKSIAIAGDGIVQGAKHAGGAVSEASSKVVEHNYGADAKEVKEEVGTTALNVGSVGLTALEQSSMMAHGAQVGKGATSEE
ncbi:protein of unknown function [Taphrina deformans PYCC 5710]|uniref:Senescence domain-containing protein n=1 Tax=Taphrina deformans (strain PYCC 5710 / ATCC 11124 / CBS 356.35 / IMI 108563 / JCM 9778 / NBRC 8474) TaxID=1097556 RepID=R4XCV6_TAPDE|nr:protein of unknown function [Taphrina deformans PYCC 5710]|eukprot:CCG81155.1 protein of unknown function [Taphrina deformans PYCC 5710]